MFIYSSNYFFFFCILEQNSTQIVNSIEKVEESARKSVRGQEREREEEGEGEGGTRGRSEQAVRFFRSRVRFYF